MECKHDFQFSDADTLICINGCGTEYGEEEVIQQIAELAQLRERVKRAEASANEYQSLSISQMLDADELRERARAAKRETEAAMRLCNAWESESEKQRKRSESAERKLEGYFDALMHSRDGKVPWKLWIPESARDDWYHFASREAVLARELERVRAAAQGHGMYSEMADEKEAAILLLGKQKLIETLEKALRELLNECMAVEAREQGESVDGSFLDNALAALRLVSSPEFLADQQAALQPAGGESGIETVPHADEIVETLDKESA